MNRSNRKKAVEGTETMNRKKLIIRLFWIAVLSILEVTQFMLVMFGCAYLSTLFEETYPIFQHLRPLAPLMGFLTLVYPVYILVAMKLPEKKDKS